MALLNLRIQKGLSQKKLAQVLEVKQSTVSSWETGQRFPRKKVLEKLAAYFNCTIDELL